MVQPLWNTVWQLFRMLNITSPYELATLLTGIHSREMKTRVRIRVLKRSAVTHDGSKEDTIQMSINWWMDGWMKGGIFTEWTVIWYTEEWRTDMWRHGWALKRSGRVKRASRCRLYTVWLCLFEKSRAQSNPQRQGEGQWWLGAGDWLSWVSFMVLKCSRTRGWWWHSPVNLPKPTESHTLKGTYLSHKKWISWCVNYISIKLFFFSLNEH